jgi:hypothetical protein
MQAYSVKGNNWSRMGKWLLARDCHIPIAQNRINPTCCNVKKIAYTTGM